MSPLVVVAHDRVVFQASTSASTVTLKGGTLGLPWFDPLQLRAMTSGHRIIDNLLFALGGALLVVPLALATVFEYEGDSFAPLYFWIVLGVGGVAGVVLHNRRRLSGRSGRVLRVLTYILVGVSLICLLGFLSGMLYGITHQSRWPRLP